MTRNLIVLRAGDQSLHRQWLQGNADFDLLISYYGEEPGRYQSDTPMWEARKGPKWSCLADLLRERTELMVRYDAFWFPDDDLAADTAELNRMFALFNGLQLDLAQPSLTPDSYVSWPFLVQQPGNIARYVGFVEVMAPLFSRSALRRCLPTFSESRSGWGLDWIWPHLCAEERDDAVAILDAVAVRHTRPVGGDLYRRNPELDPHRDWSAALQRYGVARSTARTRYGTAGTIRRVRPGLLKRLFLRLRELNNERVARRRAGSVR